MEDETKTREQLLEELRASRQRILQLEAAEAKPPSPKGADLRLQKSEVAVQSLLESASDGIAVVEADGRIVLANAKIEDIFGYSRNELLEHPIEILLPTHYREGHVAHRVDYFAQPHQRPMGIGLDLVGRRKDGTEFPVEVSLSFVESENGLLIMAFVVDITERKKAEEALRRYAAELEARNEELDAFAHTVAHDLKDMVGRIAGFARVLEEEFIAMPEEELGSYLRIIAHNGRRMANVIDELLLLAGLRQAQELDIEPLDMARIVDEAQGRLVDFIEEQQAEITLPHSWPVALGYAPWIEEVWVNYLSNAIKYGGRPPRVEMGAAELGDGTIRFWVHDNGAGLTSEEQARLFTPFTRIGQAHTKGHGLGLSIVRRIVEKLGGQVGVESQVGQGSTFCFTLREHTESIVEEE
jgi:PAS domain S-box-containing protein